MAAKKRKKTDRKPDHRKRGPDGKFLPGDCGGPGRKSAEREGNYLRAAREEVSPAEFRQLFRKVFIRAMAGSIQAARLIFENLLPRPNERFGVWQTFIADSNAETFRVAGMSREEIEITMVREIAGFMDEPLLNAIAKVRRDMAAEKLPNGTPQVTHLVTGPPNGFNHN